MHTQLAFGTKVFSHRLEPKANEGVKLELMDVAITCSIYSHFAKC
jgi:hypothetical protein